MTNRLSKSMLAAVLLLGVSVSLAFAQSAPRKLVRFTVHASQEVKMGDVILPEGKYILAQVMDSDTNLYNLYQDDLTHAPMAIVRTVRIDYSMPGAPGTSSFLFDHKEAKQLTGWAITGSGGWQIVSVFQKKDLLANQR